MGRSQTNTKEKLLETASELIWMNSVNAVSVDDICKKADVKKGSFYHYFPSKTDLVLEVMEGYFECMRPTLDSVFSPAIDPVERFERAADIIIERQEEAQKNAGCVVGCPFASLGSEMAGQDERIRQKIEAKFALLERYYITTLRDLIDQGKLREDLDVKAKANDIYSYITGQLLMARILNTLEPLKRDLKKGILRIVGINKKVLEKI